MNAKQRRKHRRAYPERYWTQKELDAVKLEAARLMAMFSSNKVDE